MNTVSRFVFTSVLVLTFCFGLSPSYAGEKIKGLSCEEIALAESSHIADVAEQVVPAVVAIVVEGEEQIRGMGDLEDIFPFRIIPPEQIPPRAFRTRALGSGLIVDGKEGWIVTNNHVVENAEKVTIRYTGGDGSIEVFEGGDVRTDPKTEIAVVKIQDLDGKTLPEVRFGDSDLIRVGETVLAVGSPFGLHQSVSRGIVSATGRSGPGGGVPGFERIMYRDFIQTDAAINRGNSGGPLVNLKGEAVGVNTFIESTSMGSQGVGFAIPINLAKTVVKHLIKEGRVIRGYLGITMVEVRQERAEDERGVEALRIGDMDGILVKAVSENSPAAKSGLEPGDVILKYAGDTVTRSALLQRLVQDTEVGETIELEIYRPVDEEYLTLRVVIEEQPEDFGTGYFAGVSPRGTGRSKSVMGMKIRDLSDADRERLRLSEDTTGVIVVEVDAESEAATEEGIGPDTVIIEACGRDVADLDEFLKAVEDCGREEILLRVIIEGRFTYRALTNPGKSDAE